MDWHTASYWSSAGEPPLGLLLPAHTGTHWHTPDWQLIERQEFARFTVSTSSTVFEYWLLLRTGDPFAISIPAVFSGPLSCHSAPFGSHSFATIYSFTFALFSVLLILLDFFSFSRTVLSVQKFKVTNIRQRWIRTPFRFLLSLQTQRPLKCSKLVTYFHCANRTRSASHAYLPVNKVSKLFVDHFFIVRSISPSLLLADSFFYWVRGRFSSGKPWASTRSSANVLFDRWACSSSPKSVSSGFDLSASLNGLFISLMNIFNEIFSLTKCRLLCRISIYFVVRTSAIAALSIALYIALLTLLVDHWLVCVDVRRNLCESLWFITIDMHDSWPARFINKNRCHSMVELISSGEKPARRVVCVL